MQALTAGKVKGLDLSHHNGTVDFKKVKAAGFSFVHLKASEGFTYTDPTYLSNVKAAKAAGLHVGAYHFARPDTSKNDAVNEANYFVTLLKKESTDLLPVLDLEASKITSASALASWVDTFVTTVKKATNKPVMVYTGLWFMNNYPTLSTKLSKYPLWVSYYRTSPPPNNGWTSWTEWQYTDKGTVPGVSGNVDLNVATSLEDILVAKPTIASPMYDLSFMKDYKLLGIRSSTHSNEINEGINWAMAANANCVLLLKRNFDLRLLQKTLNAMYPESE